ncbi:MAG: Asp-tRNA(Asn)/Glu-tRNA(Gln) amidotransferase subunit GatC [Chloroflexi bacterium]|jgi:aspartyl-tRNA(Asn)/glutamyl-tRNA(Gln) amidotransferase subunit C|nr:Asp-tRNA(Asn)/Glu-tRNA(Gln) amidotransferase subunit GatC [Chloroflexota bacterium]
MGLTREQVLHIARLARLGVSEEDVAKFQEQLSQILAHFETLRELDTEGVPPTPYPLELESVMRPDEVRPSLSQEDVLANAPLAEEGAFRVQAVLEE